MVGHGLATLTPQASPSSVSAFSAPDAASSSILLQHVWDVRGVSDSRLKSMGSSRAAPYSLLPVTDASYSKLP